MIKAGCRVILVCMGGVCTSRLLMNNLPRKLVMARLESVKEKSGTDINSVNHLKVNYLSCIT